MCICEKGENLHRKLEIVMGFGFIIYLHKHMGSKEDMVCISQSFGLVMEKQWCMSST